MQGYNRLNAHCIDIWLIDVEAHRQDSAEYAALLDAEEKARWKRFVFPKDQQAFLVAHGVQRILLSRYLDVAPQDIVFHYGEHRKPYIDRSSIEFNLSHSGSYALLAITQDTPIGVDIECMATRHLQDEIVERFFSPAEYTAYCALPDTQKTQAFYAGWTRKEAFIKAEGSGVFFGLDKFDVTLTPDDARVLAVHQDTAQAKAWQLHDVSVPAGYRAAVAWKGVDKKRKFYTP